MKDTVREWSELQNEERRDDNIEWLHKNHLEKIETEWLSRHGLYGKVRTQDREAYKQIRQAEDYLSMERVITIQKLEELNREYNPDKKTVLLLENS
jgi:hypothetical protein